MTEKPLGPLDIIEQAEDITYEQARQLLSRMAKEGAITSVSRGKYILSQSSQLSHFRQPSHVSQTSLSITATTREEDCDDCDDCDEKIIVTTPKGLGKRCHICKRNEAIMWWPGDVPRCAECKEKEVQPVQK